MATIPYIYDELADLLAGMNPDRVLKFHTSLKSQKRLEELLAKNKEINGLSNDEQRELEQFMVVEQIVSLAKARALKKIAARAK